MAGRRRCRRYVASVTRLRPTTLALLAAVLYVPFTVFGYGTDIDITNILRSGESLLDGDYRYARPPGALPYEALVGVLDRVGGSVLVNLASVAMAVVVLVCLGRLVSDRAGDRAGRIAIVVVATQPWFWVAATSLGDYVFALGLLLLGVGAASAERRVLAGLAFGTAVGFRSGSVVLVGAYLLAELLGDRDQRTRMRSAAITAAWSGLVAVLWFVPPWLSVGRTARFLDNELRTQGIVVQVARWGVKNIAFFGVLTMIVLVVRSPVVLAALRRFRSDLLVRFAVLAAIGSEMLFLRFPWKPVHLLPMIVCVAVLLARNPETSNRLVGAVVVAQLSLAFVSITVAEPDVVDRATSGRLHVGITAGVVVNDLDCRLDAPFDAPEGRDWPDLDDPEADRAAIAVFACQARSWRAGQGPDDPPPP